MIMDTILYIWNMSRESLLDEIIEKPTQYHTVKAFYEFLVWFLSKLDFVLDLNLEIL